MVPGRLAKNRKRYRMLTAELLVCFRRLANFLRKFRAKKSIGRRSRLEHDRMADDFTAVCADNLRWRDCASLFADVKIRRAIDVDTALCHIHAALRVMRETR